MKTTLCFLLVVLMAATSFAPNSVPAAGRKVAKVSPDRYGDA